MKHLMLVALSTSSQSFVWMNLILVLIILFLFFSVRFLFFPPTFFHFTVFLFTCLISKVSTLIYKILFQKQGIFEATTPGSIYFQVFLACQVASQLRPTLQPYGLCPPSSSVYEILQARNTGSGCCQPTSRGSSQPRDLTCISFVLSITYGQVLYHLAPSENPFQVPFLWSVLWISKSLIYMLSILSFIFEHFSF